MNFKIANNFLRCSRILFLICLLVIFGCSLESQKTFNNFGFSLKYPEEMVIKEERLNTFATAPDERSGLLRIGKPDVFFEILTGKQGGFIEVAWVVTENNSEEALLEALKKYLNRRKTALPEFKELAEKHKFRIGSKKLTFKSPNALYLGQVQPVKSGNKNLIQCRFCTKGEGHFILLSVVGAWYCDLSKRIFIVSSSASWKKFGLITDGSNVRFAFPDLKKDPSYKPFKKVLSTLKSTVDKTASRVVSEKKLVHSNSDNHKEVENKIKDRWVELVTLEGNSEMQESEAFRLSNGRVKVYFQLQGEKSVEGKLNKTVVMLFRSDLTPNEAYKKGQEKAKILSAKVVWGSGSNSYPAELEPGEYKLHAYSPAGANWSIKVKEKRE